MSEPLPHGPGTMFSHKEAAGIYMLIISPQSESIISRSWPNKRTVSVN
jgi:hypothetical protein